MFDVDEQVDAVLERFIEDIHECIDAVNRALPHYGKELHNLSVNPQQGKIDIRVEDLRLVVH